MTRKRIPDDVQAHVLTRSRRRCCICYGLNRDTSIKQGQIAHIDQDSANAAEDNLVFLCMPCHDKYDSITRQSKNFTAAEIRHFRDELDQALTSAFSQPVAFGEVLSQPRQSSANHYIRIGGGVSSAELTIHTLPNGDVRVVGEALWGTNREYGPNIGTLDFLATPDGGVVRYEDHLLEKERPYRAVLRFVENGLVFEEEGFNGYFGMNVTFAGTYARAT
ncbi:HNH endonuclease [Burkholderia anthina]|uniref:HNH endonuclease n=1 Tax=Burkholderia anthina TaxID=179879 RepID=UPI0012D8E352|nr:HNH endonuclease [Burkholderia anthina]